jgi:DNA repair ATPase RecN
MGSDLRRRTAGKGSIVHTAEFVVSSARLAELHECSALLRRTRLRAEEIVDEARTLLAEAERDGDELRAMELRAQLDEARRSYCQVLNAYMIISRRITTERQEIVQAQMEADRDAGLTGVA